MPVQSCSSVDVAAAAAQRIIRKRTTAAADSNLALESSVVQILMAHQTSGYVHCCENCPASKEEGRQKVCVEL